MIDWLTLSIDASLLDDDTRHHLDKNTGSILKIDKEGQLEWCTNAREIVKSDSHQIVLEFGSFLRLYGSPARVIHTHNVFGSDDIKFCALSMINFICNQYEISLPLNLQLWKCTRIDIAFNYDLGSQEQAEYFVDIHKSIKLGQQKVSTWQYMVSFGGTSTVHSGKIYHKGHDLKRLLNRGKVKISQNDLLKSMRIVRLEYSMRRKILSNLSDNGIYWYQITESGLRFYHSEYFKQYIGQVQVIDMDNILDRLIRAVKEEAIPTEGQARAAYDCYMRIKDNGFTIAKTTYTPRTFYRHIKNLRAIGLNQADLQKIQTLKPRFKKIELAKEVTSFDDIILPESTITKIR